MTFARPLILLALLGPLALFVWDLTRKRRRGGSGSHPKILRAEAGPDSLQLTSAGGASSVRQGRPRWWLFAGLSLAIVALARPQYGRLEEPVFDQSREILLAIDLSRSMLTPDVKPTRLERSKLLIQALLERLEGERVGLVVFSGTAFLQSPLSADYEILREFLPALGPDFLPEGGTNYGALLETSLAAFGSTNSADRFLIILSDGEATDDNWKDKIEELKKANVRVIGLGIGTTSGAMIPDGTGGFVKDDRGAVVMSKLESGTLRQLAEATNGVYQDASTWVDLAALIKSTVEAGQKGKFVEKNTVRLAERFQWALAPAVLCLLLSFWREFPIRPRPREVKLTGAPVKPASSPLAPGATAAATTIAALLFAGLLAIAPRARAAEDLGPQVGRVYARLATQDSLTAQDYAEIARETLLWGQHRKENNEPVTPGPVLDAIQAVDNLIAINSKIADWTQLRSQLEALLEKPEDKKQDDKKDDQKKDQKQDQQNQQQQNQQNQQNQSDQQKDQNQQGDNGEKKDSKDQPPQQQKDSAFGDMKKDQPPPPQDGNTQKVGGTPEKKENEKPADAALVMPSQKLDQLRQQDSPAELFQMLRGEQKGQPDKKGKNW